VSTVSAVIDAPVGAVWRVLADGWSYSDWVVGTAHVRDVDASWPAVGSDLHHKVGPWPASREEFTRVLAMTRDRHLVLAARLWPAGEARVEITLEAIDDLHTRVNFFETASKGPMKWLHNPVQDRLLTARNREGLQRLSDLTRKFTTDADGPAW
jgi:Polyketide cyclase / dehydrase and lipid transport